MSIKGLDALRRHVPELNQPGGVLWPLIAIGSVILLTTLFFVAADRGFAEWMPDGEIVILALGFLILSRFFSQRKVYRQKYGEMAYRKAFARFSVPGVGIIIASIAHLAYIAGPDIPNLWWESWLVVLGWLLVWIGLTLWMRSVTTLGLDNVAMLYVYYPDETRPIDTGLYGILRHPIYAAALDMGLGLALIHASWYALLVALIMPIFFAGWIRLVEEPELIDRFPGYLEYRKGVPAFWTKPIDLPKFYRYLLNGD